eukprot:NODE_2073_length_513_cov_378.280172_g1693_i0.p1 GENE.NODE_2073_length_513_cov_378.280172_g1693_i0~~NODE_2073_length_513_cov_378.280172_g1693_i0.p1  ORF type:complete len:153 (-),score=37.67 NODE_2073_length_513_cov_378.280172_g1693_i0:55-483(-)
MGKVIVEMKKDQCSFSGAPVHPGHGIRYVPCISVQATKPVLPFSGKKSCMLYLRKKNPRKICWTVVCRRLHKKGEKETVARRRTRKVRKVQRAIVGADLETINKKRKSADKAPRAAAKDAALKEVQERKDRQAGKKKPAAKK